MTKTWQWLLILGISTLVYLMASMLMEEPYDFDYELQRPDQPFKQLIWDVKTEGP